MIKTSAFHDYDIRGIYPHEVDEQFYYHLGRAAAAWIKTGTVLIGRDMRSSSLKLHDSLAKGLLQAGVDVVSVGLCSTEMFYFQAGRGKYDLGIIVSASHNPPQYNGAKIMRDGTVPVHSGSGLAEIRKIMESLEYSKTSKKGKFKKINIFDQWIKHALSFISIANLRKMKIVVDAGNGMGGPSWLKIASKIKPVEIIPLYCNPDGSFPNHLADPLKDENLQDAREAVVKNKAQGAIVLDGDADRLFLIDEKAEKLSGTVTTALITDYLLGHKKGPILYSVTCGNVVKETAEKHGVQAVLTRVGHSFIKEKMREVDGLFAGEHSGHLYFKDNNFAESSLIAGLMVLELMGKTGKSLSVLRKYYDIYPQSGEINFTAENSKGIIRKIKDKFRKNGYKIRTLDGLTVEGEQYWFNLRASNTEPLLRLNIEAENKKILQRRQAETIKLITNLGAKQK